MAYHIVDIETTDSLPTLELSEGYRGFAVIVRRKGRLIHFWMHDMHGEEVLPADELGREISRRARTDMLKAAIVESLRPEEPAIQHPSVTVAICTHDRPALVDRCLTSLQQIDLPSGFMPSSLEILVVDNAPSDDRTREIVARKASARYVVEARQGLDFARNRALEEASGELVAFLDDDVVVDPMWLSGLCEAWRENPDAGCFTGLVLPYELETEAQIIFEQNGGFGRGFKKVRFGSVLPGNSLYPTGAGIFGAGANMAVRASFARELGGFDEALDMGRPLPGGGDLDMFYRIVRAGYPLVYEPQFLVYHEHRTDLHSLRRQYRSWGQGFMAFVCKTYKADPVQRGKLRRLVLWWFKYQADRFQKSLRGRLPLSAGMILAELGGGIAGLAGTYSRARRRAAEINARQPAESPMVEQLAA